MSSSPSDDAPNSYPTSFNDAVPNKEKTRHTEDVSPAPGLHAMSAEDRAAALRLANEADPGPALGSWGHIQFLMMCSVVIVCSCDTGFDTTIMSSVNSMRQFQNFFGLESGTPGTGIVFVSFDFGHPFLSCPLMLWSRVYTLSEGSVHSSRMRSCLILSDGDTRCYGATVSSCEWHPKNSILSKWRFFDLLFTQHRRYHLCQLDTHVHAPRRQVAHWVWL